MQIRQLHIANDHLQDRLILRVAKQADEECRICLTRRFLRERWPHLAALLGKLTTRAPAMAEMEVAEQASFEQPH